MTMTNNQATERFPLVVRKARIKAGAFCGCEKASIASSLDIADGEFTTEQLSRQEPKSVFGLFAHESRGLRNLGWWKNGARI